MRRIVLVAVLAVATACSGPDGTQGNAGPQGAQGVVGPQGLPGASGPQGLQGPPGPRGANWVGGWSALARYQPDDGVDYQGSSYVAVNTPVLGLAPPNTDWQLVASAGATGAEGPQGPKGDTGAQGPAGLGSVIQVDTGAGLTGGPITASGVISIAPGGVTNAMLASSGVTVTAGAGLSGGGLVALGGAVSLAVADLAGDVTGSPGSSTVTALQGSPVAATTPADGQVMAWSAGAGAWTPTTLVIPQLASYRFAVFNTYDDASGWMANNDASLFGGITPSAWTDGGAIASQLSADKEVLRTLLNRKGYAGANALVHAETFSYYSSTNGKVVVALFRVRNTTAAAITWTPVIRVTAYGSWGEQASVALNGASAWTSAGGTYLPSSSPVSVPLAIPASRTSTAIFVSTGSPPGSPYSRSTLLAFVANSLALPAGLQFVDDFDTATGGWSQ
jgi:hypothetical protein